MHDPMQALKWIVDTDMLQYFTFLQDKNKNNCTYVETVLLQKEEDILRSIKMVLRLNDL